MAQSQVYLRIHYLLNLEKASIPERKTMLTNITQGQLGAILIVIDRVLHGIISPMRRDALVFQHHWHLFRTLTSTRVTFARKKALLRRHHTLIPRLLRVSYLIQAILNIRHEE